MRVDLAAWVVTIGLDDDGDLALQAVKPDPDLSNVDALEHRFLLGGVEGEGASAVLFHTALHRCKEADGECETFHAPEGETSLDDVEDDLQDAIREVADLSIVDPSTWDEEVEFDDSESVEIEIDSPAEGG